MARKIRLFSPLAPVPLARRLEEEMDREWTQAEKNKGRIFGQGTEHKIFLKVERWGQTDDSAYSLEGTMRAERGGTQIDAKLGRGKKATFFVVFWFGFLSIFIIVGLLAALLADTPLPFTLMFTGIPAVMMVAGAWFFSHSAKRGPEDIARITAFLEDLIDAREIRDLG